MSGNFYRPLIPKTTAIDETTQVDIILGSITYGKLHGENPRISNEYGEIFGRLVELFGAGWNVVGSAYYPSLDKDSKSHELNPFNFLIWYGELKKNEFNNGIIKIDIPKQDKKGEFTGAILVPKVDKLIWGVEAKGSKYFKEEPALRELFVQYFGKDEIYNSKVKTSERKKRKIKKIGEYISSIGAQYDRYELKGGERIKISSVNKKINDEKIIDVLGIKEEDFENKFIKNMSEVGACLLEIYRDYCRDLGNRARSLGWSGDSTITEPLVINLDCYNPEKKIGYTVYVFYQTTPEGGTQKSLVVTTDISKDEMGSLGIESEGEDGKERGVRSLGSGRERDQKEDSGDSFLSQLYSILQTSDPTLEGDPSSKIRNDAVSRAEDFKKAMTGGK